MTVWQGASYRYVSVDSANDLTTATLTIGTDGATYPVTAEMVVDPAPDVAARLASVPPAPKPGMARYWWRVFTGAGSALPVTAGVVNTLYGLLTDSPEIEPYAWHFRPE